MLDYLTLVEETGKIIREDKRGHLSSRTFPLLQQLGLNSEDWLQLAQHFGKQYHQAVGTLKELSTFAAYTNSNTGVFIENDGKLAIGSTTAGAYSLYVNGTSLFTGNLHVSGSQPI